MDVSYLFSLSSFVYLIMRCTYIYLLIDRIEKFELYRAPPHKKNRLVNMEMTLEEIGKHTFIVCAHLSFVHACDV
jgi:hypothetical protein